MRKLNLLYLTIILCLITGCHEQSVENLMKDKYGIDSAKEISREEFKGNSKCRTDAYITATFKENLFKEIEFHIWQWYEYGMESCNAHYEDDFEDMKLNEYFDSFKNRKNLIKEYKTIYLKDDKYLFNQFRALGTFNNKAELESLVEELELFKKHISKQKYNISQIPYVFTKNTSYFNYEISTHWLNSEETIEGYLEQVMENYDIDAMKEFSEKEMQQVLSKNMQIGTKTNDTCNFNGKYIVSIYPDNISMGTLYYLLQDIGYTVIGNQYNYASTINSHTLNCDISSNEICRIDGRPVENLKSTFDDSTFYSRDRVGVIRFPILNDLLGLNLCDGYNHKTS